jgi:hypothetical protein
MLLVCLGDTLQGAFIWLVLDLTRRWTRHELAVHLERVETFKGRAKGVEPDDKSYRNPYD